jgi:hypothetical protein
MRIERITSIEAFTIFDADGLDPITVFLQDIGPGKGRLVIECWCEAWGTYWGAMGDCGVREFVMSVDAGYIVNRLISGHVSKAERHHAYTLRIVQAVQQALRSA